VQPRQAQAELIVASMEKTVVALMNASNQVQPHQVQAELIVALMEKTVAALMNASNRVAQPNQLNLRPQNRSRALMATTPRASRKATTSHQ
jgi:predicted transcriptional regulator YheO